MHTGTCPLQETKESNVGGRFTLELEVIRSATVSINLRLMKLLMQVVKLTWSVCVIYIT